MKNNFISLATRAMCGLKPKPYQISLLDIDYVCVKAPMFSFTRLRGADPTLGVEMSSTGEVACYGHTTHEAFMQAMMAANFKLPEKNRTILLSIASQEFLKEFEPAVAILSKLGYTLYGTPGTCKYYKAKMDLDLICVSKPVNEDDMGDGVNLSALNEIRNGKIDLLINISDGTEIKGEISAGYFMRRASVDFGTSLIVNIKCAIMFAEALEKKHENVTIKHIKDFYDLETIGWHAD